MSKYLHVRHIKSFYGYRPGTGGLQVLSDAITDSKQEMCVTWLHFVDLFLVSEGNHEVDPDPYKEKRMNKNFS